MGWGVGEEREGLEGRGALNQAADAGPKFGSPLVTCGVVPFPFPGPFDILSVH